MAKKLIAARPIQFRGRTYERGDTLPAYDERLTDAWLKAGSAKWEEAAQKAAPTSAEAAAQPVMDPAVVQAIQVLDNMGIKITDDAGEFCGEEELIARITSAVAPGGEGQEGQPADGAGEYVPAHLDADALAKLKTEDLERLATDMGVDLSACKTNPERAEKIAAVEVLIAKTEAGE